MTQAAGRTLTQRFNNHIKRECADRLMSNPIAQAISTAAATSFGQISQVVVEESVTDYFLELRAAAFIFGDTYKGMVAEDAIKILFDEGFLPYQEDPSKPVSFCHEYLGMRCFVTLGDEDKIHTIILRIHQTVNANLIKPHSLDFIGIINCDIRGNMMIADIDVTGGLRTKMHVLKSFVSSESNESEKPAIGHRS